MKNGIQDYKALKYSNSDQYLQKKSPNRMDSVTSDSSDCQISGCEDNSNRSLSSDTRILPATPSDLRPHHISDENLIVMNSTDNFFSYVTQRFGYVYLCM